MSRVTSTCTFRCAVCGKTVTVRATPQWVLRCQGESMDERHPPVRMTWIEDPAPAVYASSEVADHPQRWADRLGEALAQALDPDEEPT